MAVRVASLYFIEGWTQGEIAKALHTNRLRINRIINDARRSGLVTFTLNSRLTSCIELERELVTEFGLKQAIIVPTPRNPDLVRAVIGQATANYIAQLLGQDRISRIATSWGETIREVIRYLPRMQRPDLLVCSALGGLTHGIEINTFDIVASLARQLGAGCRYLAAPLYVADSDTRAAILAHDPFRCSFAEAASSDMILLSVGDMSDRSLLMSHGLPAEVLPDDLIAHGACGDVIGHLIDRDGQPIDHPLNRRCIALPLEGIRDIPNAIVACGGMYKAEALAATLSAGWGNVLVCDEDTARAARAIAKARHTAPAIGKGGIGMPRG